MIKPYLLITKPGIILGNLISVTGGFLLAARGDVSAALFIATLVGVSLVIASGCVFNNYIDRDIDALMARTQNRPLVQGQISSNVSLGYGSALGMAGFLLLYWQTNVTATLIALIGWVIYVGFYSLYLKRRSVYGTLIGSLSGATPPVIGYCAVTHQFDAAALILLLIFSFWQMPHSYAIAIFRFKDYQAAKIPVLPLVEGIPAAKRQMLFYVFAFAISALMLTLMGYTGIYYFTVVALLSGYWLWLVYSDHAMNSEIWAKRLFVFSILAITTLSIMLATDFSTESYSLVNV